MIDEYLNYHKTIWSASTLRSERHRLNVINDHIEQSPDNLWNRIKHLKPYTRKTYWIRAMHYMDWLIEHNKVDKSINAFKFWYKRHKKLFSNVYYKKAPMVSLEEAKKRINAMPEGAYKKAAKAILYGGLRFSELSAIKNGTIVGKGGKQREIMYSNVIEDSLPAVSYASFRRQLIRHTGLRPHDLRKIRATWLCKKGFNLFEIMEVMGWASMETAKFYIASEEKSKLKKRIEELDV